MSELAPWESSAEGGRRSFHPDSPTASVYKLPARLPDAYKPQTRAFVAPSGQVVAQPPPPPRPLTPRGKLTLTALLGGAVVGVLWVVFVLMMFGVEAGAVRFVYAGIGGAFSLVCIILLMLEIPRIRAYQLGNFIPGVLVYGNTSVIEKVVGNAGVSFLTSRPTRGKGAGLMNKIFDRSKHTSAPPEVVGLHVNVGRGPEIVGIEWPAVYEFQRGDVVWFQPMGVGTYLMFHKLIPYAPWVSPDEKTRRHIFTELKVGAIKPLERKDTKNMGSTKTLSTDKDGKIVTKEITKKQSDQRKKDGGKTAELGLSAQGTRLGGDDQSTPQDEFQVDPDADDDDKGDFRLSEPGKSLGGGEQPEQGEPLDES